MFTIGMPHKLDRLSNKLSLCLLLVWVPLAPHLMHDHQQLLFRYWSRLNCVNNKSFSSLVPKHVYTIDPFFCPRVVPCISSRTVLDLSIFDVWIQLLLTK